MKPADVLTLAIDAATYDAVVILWRTGRGTQPVLMPRSLGRARQFPPARALTAHPTALPAPPGQLAGGVRRTARLS